MLILDVTVVAVALPDISADLGLGRQQLTWVVSGYTLAFGGLLLLGGRAADLFGARRLVVVGLTLFAGASLLAGLAPTGWALLAGRVLQGLSAAVLSPSALSLVVTMFDGAERDRALGIWSALGAVAPRWDCCSGDRSRPARAGPGCSSSTCRSVSCSRSACAGCCRSTPPGDRGAASTCSAPRW